MHKVFSLLLAVITALFVIQSAYAARPATYDECVGKRACQTANTGGCVLTGVDYSACNKTIAAGPAKADQDPECVVDGVPTLACGETLVGNLLQISTAVVAVVLFSMFVYGAFTMLTAFGDAKKVQTAQNIFKYAVIGLIIFSLSYVVLNIIDKLFLGGEGTLLKIHLGGN